MPIVGIPKKVLDARLGHVHDEDSFQELCFEYGLELDEVTSEKEQKERETGKGAGELSAETVYRVDLPANRYDLLCAEGLCRALLIFQSKMRVPEYRLSGEPRERLTIRAETGPVRPFAVAAVLRNVALTPQAYASFIDLQDKLHQNVCRKRSLVAIGTHDLDTIEGPFVYTAEDPTQLRFMALGETEEASATELMAKYSGPGHHLRPYVPILRDQPRYPVIRDANGVVLSMPPIINGEHSKIKVSTKNVLIECTATDLTKAKLVLDTLVTLFSEYCSEPFCVEPVAVTGADGAETVYPVLASRTEAVSVADVNRAVGLALGGAEMADLLTRMGLVARVEEGGERLSVRIPPTRQDILHACDISEDVAVAYGFNRLVERLPPAATIGAQDPLNKLSDLLRHEMAAAGYTEALTFALLSREEQATKLRHDEAELQTTAVHVGNPKTAEFQVGRTSLLPGILKTLSANRDMPLPLKLFEIQDVILQDSSKDVGARNERRLCAVYSGRSSGFELIHGILDRVLLLLRAPRHHLRPSQDPTFFPGRAAAVQVEGVGEIGKLGVVHPAVVKAFDLTMPTSTVEINLQPFL